MKLLTFIIIWILSTTLAVLVINCLTEEMSLTKLIVLSVVVSFVMLILVTFLYTACISSDKDFDEFINSIDKPEQ